MTDELEPLTRLLMVAESLTGETCSECGIGEDDAQVLRDVHVALQARITELEAEYGRLKAQEAHATELRGLLLNYLPTLEDRLPKDALGPLYAALFVGPPQPLTEAEITRGQEICAQLHPEWGEKP